MEGCFPGPDSFFHTISDFNFQDHQYFQTAIQTLVKVCEERDPKGLYKRTRKGKPKVVAGVGDPYEPPPNTDLVAITMDATPVELARIIMDTLITQAVLPSALQDAMAV